MGTRIQNVSPKEYGGRKFRSTLEAEAAEMLDLMGIPFEYETRKITLLEGFDCPFQKDKVRAIHYTPDFILNKNIIIECKGFETPEWKNKKKYIYKYFMEKEPDILFYEVHSRKDLLVALDANWTNLGYAVKVTAKPKRAGTIMSIMFSSIKKAMESLHLEDKPIGALIKSFTGKAAYVYGYNWKLEKLKL